MTGSRTASRVTRGNDPVGYIKKLYIRFLKGYFNFAPSGQNCFHWEPDSALSEIMITGEHPLDMKTVGKRPAITVVMGPYQFQGLGINNMQVQNLSTEERRRTDLMNGHLVAYALAENVNVVQRLAFQVHHATRVNQQLLESVGGFHQIARPAPSVNSPSEPGALVRGDPNSLVMVQVNIPFTFQWTWITRPKAPSSERSLAMINDKPRASDFQYTSHATLEKVQLAMSTRTVTVQRLGGGGISQSTSGTPKFQTVLTERTVDELARNED